MKSKHVIARLLSAFVLAMGSAHAAPDPSSGANGVLSPAQFRADIAAMRAAIDATHPQLDYTVDVATLDRAIADIEAAVHEPLTRDEAWRRLATLNPVFSDGHLEILVADWRKNAAAWRAGGGRFFPFEVNVDPAGKVVVLSALGGGDADLKGAEITSINGVPIWEIVAGSLARTHGHTPAFRAALLSRRWWWFYWKLHGAPTRYELGIAGRRGAYAVRASGAMPAELAEDAFERTFRFELRAPHTAVLTIDAFYWEDKDRYYAFMKDAFARIQAANVSTLLIDIRANGGGDDDMWMQGILKYIAGKPYRWASAYKKKIIERYRDEGEVDGEVKVGKIDTLIQLEPDNPLAFRGRTYVLIGPYTYSSAILFANVVQDYRFATVAGTGGAAKRGQTGGIQSIVLPNSGLELVCPRFYLLPPSGGNPLDLVEPSIRIADDPLHPQRAIDALLERQEPLLAH